jgi:hypothetical protein
MDIRKPDTDDWNRRRSNVTKELGTFTVPQEKHSGLMNKPLTLTIIPVG